MKNKTLGKPSLKTAKIAKNVKTPTKSPKKSLIKKKKKIAAAKNASPGPLTTTKKSSVAIVEPGRPTANAHLGKNKKKAWRRVVVDDVETFLDDQRLDERIGASDVAGAADEDLFVLDNLGSLDPAPSSEVKKLNKRVRNSLAKPPPVDASMVFHNLRNSSKVGPATDGINRVKTPVERRQDALWIEKIEKRELTQLQQRLADMKKTKELAEARKKKAKGKALGNNAVFFDLWGGKEEVPEELQGDAELAKYTLVDHLKVKLPKTPKKMHHNSTVLPQVELPHPGMSYNPCIEDHQELVQKVVNVELSKEKEEDKWKRQTIGMYPEASKAPTEETKLLELAEGLFEEEEEDKKEEKEVEAVVQSGDGGEDDEGIYKAPIRAEDRKTRKKRRKEHEAKMQAIEAAKAKKLRQKESAVFKVKQIKKDIEAKEKRIAKNIEIRKRKDENYKKFCTKKLGKNKYEEPDAPVKFVEEITGTLRELKPEGHLIVDRFKSLQKRNVIETRVKAKAMKRKLKRFMTRDKRKFMSEKDIKEQGMFKKLSWHRK